MTTQPLVLHALMYHDVIPDDADHGISGFPGHDAAIYKLTLSTFRRHLEALARRCPSPPVLLGAESDPPLPAASPPWALTFDDGGASAYEWIAPALEKQGWKGHFFVTTARIGDPGFLTENQIKDLHQRGHRLGSHSHTHPVPISALSEATIAAEWQTSVSRLAEITGEPTRVGSVPGGFFSRGVGEVAANAGIRYLFTSDPVSYASRHPGHACLILGRYAVKHRTLPETAASLAVGAPIQQASQRWIWSATGLAKRVGGDSYIRLRRALLNRNR